MLRLLGWFSKAMSKKEVIERIKAEIGPECDDKMAEYVFKRALRNKEITVKLIAAVIVAALWALVQYL